MLRPIAITQTIAELAEGRSAWLVDVWGVIHNGVSPFARSVAACETFRSSGGYVVLVTNAPRPAVSVVRQLDAIGVPRSAYDAIVTSGDVTSGLLRAWSDRKIHHLGPERDLPLFEGLGIKFVTSIEAELVVCTGLHDDEKETPEDYKRLLERFLRRRAAMICANPDLKVERGDRVVYCAGAIAALYESLGGDVVYAGKPHPPIYELAQSMIDRALGRAVPQGELLAIGDGVLTDIPGAAMAGYDAIYIASGIHLAPGALTSEALEHVFASGPHRPIAAMAGLAW